VGHLAELYHDYNDRADFLAVYIREAHPLDEWQMKSNVDQGVCYPQPQTLAQRIAIANDFTTRFHFPIPMGVDSMSDLANRLYAGWPERIYIVDETGKIVYRGGLGPFNYHPEEARAWLEKKFPPARASN
jgi:hypothetical protein